MDISRVADGELLYECTGVIDLSFSLFCNLTYHSNNLIYCDNCPGGASNSFGCVSLKKHQYCVLNKQYSAAAYQKLVTEIVDGMREAREWGEFFPMSLSPFSYNLSKAYDWFPLSETKSTELGLELRDYPALEQSSAGARVAQQIPSSISQVGDDFIQKPICCGESGRLFRIIPQELAFYRKKGLPLPRVCPRVRHQQRSLRFNAREIYQRYCEKCGDEIHTVYSPEAPDIVFCEKCYMAQAYG